VDRAGPVGRGGHHQLDQEEGFIAPAFPLLSAWALAPPTVLAHQAGAAQGLNVPLVAAGVLVAALGGLWAFQDRRGPLVWGSIGAGAVLLALGFLLPRLGSPDPAAAVSIERPPDGATVPAGAPVTVTVSLRGADLASSPMDHSGGHLHLYVGGRVKQMPYSRKTEVTLPPGRHVLKVEYVDHMHGSFDPEIAAEVTVLAS
jgi:hypothetical protein